MSPRPGAGPAVERVPAAPAPPETRRLRVVPAPVSWPEPDLAPGTGGSTPVHEQPMLPLLWAVPGLRRDEEPAPEALADGPAAEAPGPELPPDLEAWVARLAAGVLEVLHGARPAGQMVRWFEPRVHRALADRAARVRPPRAGAPRVAVRSVHVSVRPASREEPVVAEAAAVVAVGPRCRAVALRLSPYAGRWRVTALEVG